MSINVKAKIQDSDVISRKKRICFDNLEWKKAAQTKGDKGITIHIASVDGFDLKAIKSESIYDASIWQLRARIMDMENFSKWVVGSVQSKVIHRIDSHTQACYCEYHAPWPIKNRDGVIVQNAVKLDDCTIRINLHAKSELVEERKGLVRIDYLQGSWTFSDLGNGKTKLVYQVHSDPNGNIPDWVVNSQITEAPTTTLKNLHNTDFEIYGQEQLDVKLGTPA